MPTTPDIKTSDGSQRLVFPPDYEQRKRALLQEKGYDPEKFDLDETNGFQIIPRPPKPENTTSTLGAIGASAAYNIPEALTSLVGTRLGGMAGSAVGGPIGTFVGGLAGGIGAPMALAGPLNSLKQAVLPQAVTDYVNRARTEHPTASFIGDQSSALAALKPSLKPLMGAAGAVRSLIKGVPLSRLAASEAQGLANTAIGATVGAGISAGSDIAHSEKEGLSKLSDVSPVRALIGAAGNTLLAEPNRLGRAMGLHATPEATPAMPKDPRALMDGPRVGEALAAKQAEAQKSVVDFPAEVKIALQSMGVLREGDSPAQMEAFLNPIREVLGMSKGARAKAKGKATTEMERLKAQMALMPENARPEVQARIDALSGELDKFAAADLLPDALKEARARVNAPTEYSEMDQGGGMPAIGERESGVIPPEDTPQYQQAQAEAQKRKLDFFNAKEEIHNSIVDEVNARNVTQRAGNLQETMQANTVPPRPTHGELTRSFDQMEQVHPPRDDTDIIADEMEGTHDPKYSIRYQQLTPDELPPEVSQRYADFMSSFAQRKGVKLSYAPEVTDATGKPVAGKLKPRTDPLGDAVAQISAKGGWDTPPHELLHNLVIELGHGSAAERNLAKRALAAFGGSEENLVQASGKDFVSRFFRPENESVMRDIANWARRRFLGRENPQDLAGILTSTLMREGDRAERIAKAPPAAGAALDTEERTQRFGPQAPSKIPSRVGFNPLASETDKLRKGSTPTHARTADALERLHATHRNYFGKYSNPIIGAFEKLSKSSRERLYETLIDEDRTSTDLSGRLTPQEKAAHTETRRVIAQMAADQIAAGQLLRNGKQRGQNPFYFPKVIDAQIRRTLAEGQGHPEFDTLRTEYETYQTGQGLTPQQAAKSFERLLGSLSQNASSENRFNFRAVSTPEGIGLPDTWIERDPITAVRKYTKAFSRDRAFYDTIRKNPETMAALGSKTFENDTAIPANVLAATPNLAKDPQVGRILDSFIGADGVKQEPIINSVGRAVNTLLLGGPVTKLTDMLSVPFNALKYVAPGQYADIAKGLANWRQGVENAFGTGLNRRGGLVVAQDILGIGEVAANKMDKFSEMWTKATGSEFLELQSRGLSQAIGEFIGASHQSLAKAGNKDSTAFLQKLGSDALTLSREELGTRIAQLLQGRYDITNLPRFLKDSPIAPFLTMMRWSTEQANNFVKFVVEPARRGNFHPLAMSLIGGLGGGLVLNAVRAEVSGRTPYEPTLKELESGVGQPGFADALTYKLMSVAQVTGTLGLYGEIMRQSYEALTGRMPQGFQYPVVSVFGDLINRLGSAYQAIATGEPIEKVVPAVISDVLRTHVQAVRIVQNQLGRAGVGDAAQELEVAKQKRDQAVYTRMSGKPIAQIPKMGASYERLSEKEFDRASPKDAMSLLPGLLKRTVQKANGDTAQLQSRLRSLRSADVPGMPSPDRDPKGFADYLSWVRKTQGEENAQRLLHDYMRRRAEHQFKSSMIPSF